MFHTHPQNRRGVIAEGSQSSNNSSSNDDDDKVIITKRRTISVFTIARHVQNIIHTLVPLNLIKIL